MKLVLNGREPCHSTLITFIEQPQISNNIAKMGSKNWMKGVKKRFRLTPYISKAKVASILWSSDRQSGRTGVDR